MDPFGVFGIFGLGSSSCGGSGPSRPSRRETRAERRANDAGDALFLGVGLVAMLAVALAAVACNPQESPTSGTPVVITITNNQNQNGQNGTPGSSPSPGAGTGAFEIRLFPFGFDQTQAACNPKPPNSAGYIPVDCTAAFTATPKIPGTNTDYPGTITGTPSWTVPVGASLVQMTPWGDQPYNQNVRCLKPGEVTVEVQLAGVVGRWPGRCQ